MDAVPDPPAEEFVRVPLRARKGEADQLLDAPISAEPLQGPVYEVIPCGVLHELAAQCLLRPLVWAVVAEQEGSRSQLDQAAEHSEVLVEIEARGGRDRDQDLVPREVEARRVARVHASVLLVENRELVGGVARGGQK